MAVAYIRGLTQEVELFTGIQPGLYVLTLLQEIRNTGCEFICQVGNELQGLRAEDLFVSGAYGAGDIVGITGIFHTWSLLSIGIVSRAVNRR